MGYDSLLLPQQGARIPGLELSGAAIPAARELAGELGMSTRVCLVDLEDAPNALDAPGWFDLVFVTSGR